MKKLLISGLLLISLVACSSSKQIDDLDYPTIEFTSSYELPNEVANMAEYPNMTAIDHPFLKLTALDVQDMLDNKGTGIVYFGYPHCPYCQLAVPVISKVATNMQTNVYYVDVYEDDDKISATDQLAALNSLINNEFADSLTKDADGNPTFYTPDIFVIKDGVIVGNHEGLVDGKSGADLTDSETAELAQVYIDLFKEVQ